MTQPAPEPLLDVRGLTVAFVGGDVPRPIVTGIDFHVGQGETIAIVGESGSGKSLSARSVIRLLPRGLEAAGSVRFAGRDVLALGEREMSKVRGRQMSMILQDPFTMLNPVMRCGEQVVEALRGEDNRRLSRKARRSEAMRRLVEVGITDPTAVDRYPFQLSGGMRQRVAIAAALAANPQLLIADEPSTALDVTTQAEILDLLKSLQEQRGMGLILITHDLRVAFSVARRVYVLYAGSLVEVADASDLEHEPFHPYSLGLLLAEPAVEKRQAELIAIEGSVPSPDEVADRCSFQPRCRWAAPACVGGKPPLREVADGRATACARFEEIRPAMQAVRREGSAAAPVRLLPRTREDVLLTVTDLRKSFTGRMGQEVKALQGVSIEVGANESVGLVGESGSGKSTLGRCIVGLEVPSSGTIALNGIDASDFQRLSSAERLACRRAAQIVFQDPYSSLDPTQTIGSAIKEVLRIHAGERRRGDARVTELLELVGLPTGYARRRPSSLSGGERQRVAIARALAVEPKLLVCDEPVSALDVSVQAQVLNLFRALRDEFGLSYLFITHDLGVVRQVVDRVYVLHNGLIVEQGPVDEVLDAPKHEYTTRLIESIPRSAA
ncbi:MAG TPA: ABC transporter ATP-binding protein [Gaiellaceae bacterium]|nr:ABC transporter ATP-binding protein [Gaiellaceae bacterium]